MLLLYRSLWLRIIVRTIVLHVSRPSAPEAYDLTTTAACIGSPGLLSAGVHKCKFRLFRANCNRPTFGLTMLEYVISLMKRSGVVIHSVKITVSQVGKVVFVVVIHSPNKSNSERLLFGFFSVLFSWRISSAVLCRNHVDQALVCNSNSHLIKDFNLSHEQLVVALE
jgi:hypothetical protein